MTDHPERAGRGSMLLAEFEKFEKALSASDDKGMVGQKLSDFYLDAGYGEEADLRATMVDMMAEVGHCAHDRDVDFAACCDKATGPSEKPLSDDSGVVTGFVASMRPYSQKMGFDYESAVRIAVDHVDNELGLRRSPSA